MITIQLTPLSYRIAVAPNGQLAGTTVYLPNYLKRFNQNAWDHRVGRWILLKRYVYYNKKTERLHLPRYDFENFLDLLRQEKVAYSVEHLPVQEGLAVDIQLKDWVQDRSEMQTSAISYLTTSDDPILGLSVQTGGGKTYSLIKALSIFGRRAMICMAGLVEQWYDELKKFTTLRDEDIYIIQGAPSMSKLLQQIDKTIFPKVILCSLGTIRNYVVDHENYENYPPFEELMDRLKVGVRGIDEAHLNFHLTMMLDLRTNAAKNIALSATFDRGDRQVKMIFDMHYPKMMRFGEGTFSKYIDIYSYSYTFGGMISPKAYSTPKGYNHMKLEEWLLRKDTKLEYLFATVYSPAIHAHYINVMMEGQKLLILCSTIDMCKWFKKRLETDLRGQSSKVFDIRLYINGSPDSILDEADIIISTPGSAGTGTDVSKLRMVLMTIATGSDNLNKQTLGRLRELKDVPGQPNYVYTWCRDIIPHQNYQESRRATYRERGRIFVERTC